MDSPETPPADPLPFWHMRCDAFTKWVLLFGLVIAFFVQTALVYSDSRQVGQISEQALDGRRLWHRNNCQSCHQLYGFGGFLGPDLTNAVARLEREQLNELLTEGYGQMPAFEMESEEIDAIWAFLVAMDRTGTGQARNPIHARMARIVEAGEAPGVRLSGAEQALADVIDESGDADVAEGYTLYQTRNCAACHVLFARSALGAPDLSLSAQALSADEIMTVLEHGRPPKMPPPALSAPERAQALAFLDFLAERRSETLERIVIESASFWSTLPWWEYE